MTQPTTTEPDLTEAMEVWRKAYKRFHATSAYTGSEPHQAAARVIATALEARDADISALRAIVSHLERGLQQIAGSHPERIGIDQTDIDDVPDLGADEAMNCARSTLMDCEDGIPPDARDARIAELEGALTDAGAHLAAAISLLERGGKAAKKAAPSDRMFDQMLTDYHNSLERARAILTKEPSQ